MQRHSPNPDEKPTPFAVLTIVEVPASVLETADDERPTPFAALRIEVVPVGLLLA
jgi:hypothetical protein